jgi:hypothetical protein
LRFSGIDDRLRDSTTDLFELLAVDERVATGGEVDFVTLLTLDFRVSLTRATLGTGFPATLTGLDDDGRLLEDKCEFERRVRISTTEEASESRSS